MSTVSSYIVRAAHFTLWLVLLVASIGRPTAVVAEKSIVLEYYMHNDVGVNLVVDIPAGAGADANATIVLAREFGTVLVMDLPLTVGSDLNSTSLGAERCIAITLSLNSNPTYISDMHLCSVTYDDGIYHGTFSTMGELNVLQADRFEYGVTGGTHDFRGVQGYVVATLYGTPSARNTYHFTAHLRLPDPPIAAQPYKINQKK